MGNQTYRQGSDWSSTDVRTDPLPTHDPNASSWGNGFVASQVNTGTKGEDNSGSFDESLTDMLWRSQGTGAPFGMKANYDSRTGWAGGAGFGYGDGYWGSNGGLSRGDGFGLGIGGNQWSRHLTDQNTGATVRTDQGYGFGAGAMEHSQGSASLFGFGGSGSADLYGGFGGNAVTNFREGDKTGAGINGQYAYGVNNVALNANTPWSSSSTTVENANVRMRAASLEGYQTDDGGYGVQGSYSGGPKVSVSGVDNHTTSPLGTTDVHLGSYVSGLKFSDALPTKISRGGVEVHPDGSVVANAGSTSGGFRAEDFGLNHDFGGGNRVGAGFGSVDTNNGWDASLGWNNTTHNAEFNGNAHTTWNVRDAYVNADGPGGYHGEAGIGSLTGGGWQADGNATLGADGLHANGNASWGGFTGENAHLSSGWDGVYKTTADVGHFSNAEHVEGARLDVDGSGVHAGLDEGRFEGMSVEDVRVQNQLLGVNTTATLGQANTETIVRGASFDADGNGVRAGLDHAEFGGVAVDNANLNSDLGGYGSLNAHLGHFDDKTSIDGARLNVDGTGVHAGVDRLSLASTTLQDVGYDLQGPGGLHSNASLGEFSTGFTGEGLSFDATSDGVNLGAQHLDYSELALRDLHASGGIDGVMQSSLDLGAGHFNNAGADNVHLGVSSDGTASLSADNAHYSYLGLDGLHASQSLGDGAVGTQVDLGHGDLLGVNAGHVEATSHGDQASASVSDLNAHGLDMNDVNIGANVGDLNARVGADQLNVLDLNVGNANVNTSQYGLQGNASVSDANLDLLNAQGLGGGLDWGGQELASARTDLQANAGVENATGNWDLTNGTANGSFTNAHAGLMTDNTHLSVLGQGIDLGRTGVNLNASGSGNVDLFNGRAAGNLNLAGSEVSILGQSITAPEWAQASGSVDLGQGAVSANLGGENGVGADVNLSEGNLDLHAFGTTIDVDQGIRDAGSAISDGASAVGGAISDGAHAVGDAVSSVFSGW